MNLASFSSSDMSSSSAAWGFYTESASFYSASLGSPYSSSSSKPEFIPTDFISDPVFKIVMYSSQA
jgi:hypothetical protein